MRVIQAIKEGRIGVIGEEDKDKFVILAENIKETLCLN